MESCEYCKTGQFIKDGQTFEEYKYCPMCGSEINPELFVFLMTHHGKVCAYYKTHLQRFLKYVSDSGTKLIVIGKPPDTQTYANVKVGDVMYYRERNSVYIKITSDMFDTLADDL